MKKIAIADQLPPINTEILLFPNMENTSHDDREFPYVGEMCQHKGKNHFLACGIYSDTIDQLRIIGVDTDNPSHWAPLPA